MSSMLARSKEVQADALPTSTSDLDLNSTSPKTRFAFSLYRLLGKQSSIHHNFIECMAPFAGLR